jgi:hypothetical protein
MLFSKKVLFFIIMTLLVRLPYVYAENIRVTKEYTYQASEQDSKISSRNNALQQVKRLLLEEIGTCIESRTEVKNLRLSDDVISSVTSGVVKTEIIDESWDGRQYWIKAKMTVNPMEVIEFVKSGKKIMPRSGQLNIRQGTEYSIRFHACAINAGSYGHDDSNPAPDAYILVKDDEQRVIFNSGDVYFQQKHIGALMSNRNNYNPDFQGIGFKHMFNEKCISIHLVDWDGCEGFMCSNSSQDDVIGTGYKVCVGDQIGRRLLKTDEWKIEAEIILAQ